MFLSRPMMKYLLHSLRYIYAVVSYDFAEIYSQNISGDPLECTQKKTGLCPTKHFSKVCVVVVSSQLMEFLVGLFNQLSHISRPQSVFLF